MMISEEKKKELRAKIKQKIEDWLGISSGYELNVLTEDIIDIFEEG